MAIYDFSLASMYEITGVDTAMCYRACSFREKGYDVKMIFTTLPNVRDLLLYTGKGLDYGQIISVPFWFSDIKDLAPKMDLQSMIGYLKNVLNCTQEEWLGDFLLIKKDGIKTAAFRFTENRRSFYYIDYFYNDSKWNMLFRTDYYSDTLYATVFYENKDGAMSERIFYNRDGSIALRQIFREKEEYNVFPNGAIYNGEELLALFVQNLNLTKKDLVILDRGQPFSSRALLACYEKTNLISVFHAEHYNLQGYGLAGVHLSREYWYWCKYSKYIHTMIVGTEEQKLELQKLLSQYKLFIPEIYVIPPFGLDQLRYPKEERKRKSIACVSRLDRRKKIEWTILAAVKAHEMDEQISLDVYGIGVQVQYIEYLQQLISKYDAYGYVSLKGFVDVKEIYQNYELFLSTSLGESFGITLLEAAGSGLPLVGLDVRYGNRLFIEDGRNGYLVEYNPEHFYEECPSEVEELADRIVEILSDEEKWKAFSKRSYEIAGQYLSEQVKQKWYDLICPKMTI